MKLTAGLFSDCSPQDTPEGSYPFAKNIVDGNVLGVKENEDGFLYAGIPAPYTVIGARQVGKDFVVFSTNNTNSEIGLCVRTGEIISYQTIYNDNALAFNTSHPIIDIEYRIDVNNQRTVAWTDNLNPPRLINIDNPPATGNIQELNIFRDINNPALSTYSISDTGGSLTTGAYIVITKYRNSLDLAETNWFLHEHVFYINDDPILGPFQTNDGAVGGTASAKRINLTFTGNDTRYDTLIVGYLQSTNGVITARQVLTIPNSGSVTTSITGGETGTTISTDSVVTSTTSYSTAESLTQLAGRLFLANLTADPMPALQQAALNIQVTWGSTLVNAVTNAGSYKDTTPPTLLPGEVYSLYLGVELNKGGWRAYHIPGRAANTGETDNVTNYGMTYKRFQVEDNSTALSTNLMNYWENANEVYPNTSDFNNGTVDLRGLAVRHHRLPTLAYLSSTTYSSDPTFGVTSLPRLYLNVSNVIIPSQIQSQIKRWKIFYAKKTATNSLVTGTDLLHYAFKTSANPGVSTSTGGNWYVGTTHSGWQSFDTPDTTKVRVHSLDYLFNRNLPTPSYVNYAYKLRSASLAYLNPGDQYNGFGTVGNITVTGNNRGGCASAVIDFSVNATKANNTAIAALSAFTYLPQASINGADSNLYNEANYVATLAPGFSPTSLITFTQVATRGTGETSQDNQFDRLGFRQVDTLFGVYCTLLSSVHSSFTNQILVPLEGYSTPSSTTGTFTGGDGFVTYMSYLTAGPLCANPIGNIGQPSVQGIRMWNAYVGYSRNNWNFRNQVTGEIGTYYYDKTDPRTLYNVSMLTLINPADPFNNGAGSSENTLLDLASVNLNSLNYNIDYSVHNEYTSSVIFDTNIPSVTKLPNTIIFTPVGSEESQVTSWKTFLAGDRYVMPKNKGYIVNLQGLNNKQLLIHMQYTLFRTRTDIQMATAGASSNENVFFQSASIFALAPEEVLPVTSGYAGTQHKQSCTLTKAGYFFVDDNQGKAFLYSGQLEEISSNGLRNFFKNFKLELGNTGTEALSSNGYTSAYDERNNRILVSKKEGSTSWTLSYNPQKKVWISYHDYIPDHLFNTVDNVLWSVKNNTFYIHNLLTSNSAKGLFYDLNPFSSFIDQTFNPNKDSLFKGVSWVTEVYPNDYVNGQYDQNIDFNSTLTHVTLRGLEHCTARTPLVYKQGYSSLYSSNVRNLNRTWYFNDIRDVSTATGFTQGFYSNFELDGSKLNINTPWYSQRRFIDKFVTCRFEYDNTANQRCLFLEADVIAEPAVK